VADQLQALSQTDLGRLRELLDQAGLETGSPAQMGADTFAPDAGQIVAPDGTVTYDFDAHLHARGIDLDAGPLTTPPGEQVVRWLRLSDGAQVASVTAYSDPAALNEASIRSRNGANTRIATLRCNTSEQVGAGQAVYAQALSDTAGDITHKLADQAGRSSFLKLVGAQTSPTPLGANVAVNVGTGSFAFSGGFTTGPAIAHGLGGTPTCVLLTPISNVGPPVLNVITVTATTFTPQVVTPGFTGGGTVTFFWLAIGPGA
jgi:hypothetical protein